MKCGEFRKRIEDLIDGNVDSKLKEEMESHMNGCSACREEYVSMSRIIGCIKRDAASVNLADSQRKGVKEIILRAPARKSRDLIIMKRLMYVAAVFMFAAIGVYFTRGIRVNIVPSNVASNDVEIDELRLQMSRIENEKAQLQAEKLSLQKENETLKKSLSEKPKVTTIAQEWTIVNTNLGEAFIQGKVLSVDGAGKKIKLEVYKDDNTPNIDPNIEVPDGIYIFSHIDGEDGKFSYITGSVDNLKAGDEIALHYMSKSKSTRAILILKKGQAGS